MAAAQPTEDRIVASLLTEDRGKMIGGGGDWGRGRLGDKERGPSTTQGKTPCSAQEGKLGEETGEDEER